MNFLSFEYFVAAANAESIRQAANTLMISPQSLSEQLRKLEQELGVELFTHTRPARLTICGERFLRYAETMLLERHELERDLRELSDKQREIILSVSAADCPPFVMEVIAAFSEKYPQCLISVAERPNPITPLTLRAYDLNISSQRLSDQMNEILLQASDFQGKLDSALNTNHLAVVVHRKLLRRIWGGAYEETLQETQAAPTLTAFQALPFIRFSNPDFDVVLDEYFAKRSFYPNLVAKSESSEIALELCVSGAGAMVVPDGWALRKLGHRINDTELILFGMTDTYPLMQTIISYQKGKALSTEEEALIQMMREFVASL